MGVFLCKSSAIEKYRLYGVLLLIPLLEFVRWLTVVKAANQSIHGFSIGAACE